MRSAAKRKQMLVDGIFVSEILARKRITDDDFVRLVKPLVFTEGFSTKQRNAKSGKILRIGPTNNRILTLAYGQGRMLSNGETAVSTIALPRNRSNESSSLNTRQGSHALDQSFRKRTRCTG